VLNVDENETHRQNMSEVEKKMELENIKEEKKKTLFKKIITLECDKKKKCSTRKENCFFVYRFERK